MIFKVYLIVLALTSTGEPMRAPQYAEYQTWEQCSQWAFGAVQAKDGNWLVTECVIKGSKIDAQAE